jgi:hypothetical protein
MKQLILNLNTSTVEDGIKFYYTVSHYCRGYYSGDNLVLKNWTA